MVAVFREIRRVLRKDGTLWLNLGDCYNAGTTAKRHPNKKGHYGPHAAVGYWLNAGQMGDERVNAPGLKPKDLVGIPWRVAFALQADGWWLRSDIVWSKPNPMPESVTDRPTKAHEYVFLLTKSAKYYYDAEAIREAAIHEGRIVKATGAQSKNGISPDEMNDRRTAVGFTEHDTIVAGRNKRSVWEIATQPFSGRALSGDMPDIVSPDCPVHGDSPLAQQARRAARDDVLLATGWLRSSDNADGPAASPGAESGANFEPHSESDYSQSSVREHTRQSTDGNKTPGLTNYGDDPEAAAQRPSHTNHKVSEASDQAASVLVGADESFAIRHSNESHRTVEQSSQRGMPSEEPVIGIEYTSPLPLFAALHHDRTENREAEIAQDWGGHPARTASRSAHTLACICIIPDHFAVFPEALVLPCIQAGTSEWGCCSVCGAPWERVVERGLTAHDGKTASAYQKGSTANRLAMLRQAARQRNGEYINETRTIGWQPTCKHEAPVEQAIVLDPFLGSGTTALVALRAGRDFVGIEINSEYAAMAERRIAPYRGRLL